MSQDDPLAYKPRTYLEGFTGDRYEGNRFIPGDAVMGETFDRPVTVEDLFILEERIIARLTTPEAGSEATSPSSDASTPTPSPR